MSRHFLFPWLKRFALGILFAMLGPSFALAQTVSGTVSGADTGPLPGANVLVEGTYVGTSTDAQGNFALEVDFDEGPRTLVVSFTGYESRRITLEAPTTDLDVTLQPSAIQGGAVVVSASRVEESVLEAPVTVERVDYAQLQQQPQTELIASLDRLKGVDVSRSSMLISSLSTRGFNSAKSERLVQLVDGFDYISPTLSLYVGNLTGVPEIDVSSVEIVYGANSALYGANAFNGVVQFQTRDPFQDTGLSMSVRGGTRGMYEAQGRWAQQIGDRFAYKVVGSYFEADDYIATNYSTLTTVPGNYDSGSLRNPDDPRGADLVNRYGEVGVLSSATCLQPGPQGGCALSLGDLGLEGEVFTPGFTENGLLLGDYRAKAARANVQLSALLTDQIKATVSGRYATGNGIYQSSNRYAFDGIGGKSLAAKVEADSWDVHALVNDADAGDTYDLGFLGSFMNRAPFQGEAPTGFNCDGLNYAECYAQVYAGTFAGARQQGMSVEQSYAAAEEAATSVYPAFGEDRFRTARERTLENDTPGQSPTFKSDGQIYDVNGQYRFDLPGDVAASVGADYRLYTLTSEGTLYSDGINSPLVCNDGTCDRDTRDGISNYSYGGYLQLRRSFFDDALKLSAVGRLDNFRNFDPRFSPRISGVLTFGGDDQHNFRASYAQAFRQPAQLDQYISLDVGSILLLGNIGDGYEGFALQNGTVGEQISIDPLEPEQMNSVEVGYKGLLGRLLTDVSYYYSVYTNFIGTQRFFGRETGAMPDPRELSPNFGPEPGDPNYANRTRLLQVWLNSDESVTTQGLLASLGYKFSRAFVPNLNYTWSHIEDVENLIVGFNTPEHKVNAGVNGQIGDFGYGANMRWVDSYLFAMPFAEGMIDSHAVLDAQVSYSFPRWGLTVLAGGTNLTDSDKLTAYGSAPMGRVIYTGLRFNP